jgi:hypothetical protein
MIKNVKKLKFSQGYDLIKPQFTLRPTADFNRRVMRKFIKFQYKVFENALMKFSDVCLVEL